jgi:hypothetical protein
VAWIFYLKRTPGTNDYRIVARTHGVEQTIVWQPAPDFSIACRPPVVWLAFADQTAIRLFWAKGTMRRQIILWEPPTLVVDGGISFSSGTPSIAWLADGRPVIAYTGNNMNGHHENAVSVALNTAGTAWGPKRVLLTSGHVTACGQISAIVVRVGTGMAALNWHGCDHPSSPIPPGVYFNWFLGGDSWTAPRPLPFAEPVIMSQTSSVTDSAGVAHLVYAATDGSAKYFTIAPRPAISLPQSIGTTGMFETCIGVGSGDTLYAVFGRLFTATKPAGGAWSAPRRVLTPGQSGILFTQCEEALPNDGTVLVAWSEGLDNNIIKMVQLAP